MGMPVSVTLLSSTVPTTSRADWVAGGPTSLKVVLGSTTMTVNGQVQITLDDLLQTASSLVSWVPMSSAAYGQLGSTTPFAISSAWADTGLVYRADGPIAGCRLSCSAMSSSQLVLSVLQGKQDSKMARHFINGVERQYGKLKHEARPAAPPQDRSEPQRAGDAINLRGPDWENDTPIDYWARSGSEMPNFDHGNSWRQGRNPKLREP
jgi:hypothetical protein